MQIIAPARVYPVIVIGSGASAARPPGTSRASELDVLLLDAGDKFDR